MSEANEKLSAIAEQLLIGQFHRHVFLCVGDACCAAIGRDGAQAAWDALKDELKARNLSLATGPAACYRTKVGCMRICTGGPILVVYPEGTWYGGMTADRIPRFVQEHLIGGQPIEEWIFARNPLPSDEHRQKRD
jgi:(2Fe-2S) ferredoxin